MASAKKKIEEPSDGPQPQGQKSLYLCFGDEFLVKEQVDKLVCAVLDENIRQTNLIVLDGTSFDLSQLFTLVFTQSLFGGPRVILVEHTSLFMGRTDQKKLLDKTLDAWKNGDRKAAVRNVAQLIALVGVSAHEVQANTDWITDSLGTALLTGDREALTMAARTWAEEGGRSTGGSNESLLEELLLLDFPPEAVLIFTAIAADKRKKVFKTLEKRGQIIECSLLQDKSGASLNRAFFNDRVKNALTSAGKTITREALDKMFALSGKELRRLHSELHKLIAYVGDRSRINEQDVETAFGDFHEAAFFDLAKALRTGDIKRCLPALQENLKIVDHPLQTLAAILTEFRRLMVARELLFTVFRSSWRPGISFDSFKVSVNKMREKHPKTKGTGKLDLLSMNEYSLYLYLRDAEKFPLEKLLRIMEGVLEADIMLKSSVLGRSSPQTILENLLLVICSSP